MLNYEDTIAPDEVDVEPEAYRRLAARVRDRLAHPAGRTPLLVRVAVTVDAMDPFAWLQAQSATPKLYWARRGGAAATAAVGAADVVGGTDASVDWPAIEETLQARLAASHDPDLRYYGGLAFDAAQPLDDGWQAFGTHRFVLPRFELRTTGRATKLVCNLVLPRDATCKDRVLAQIERLAGPVGVERTPLPAATARTDVPDRAAWQRMMAWALDAFAQEQLSKVVLARRSTFDFVDVLDPVALLQQLHAATSNCFHFLFQPADGLAFLGASPERLFRRANGVVQAEAVAGTRSRGDSARADAALRDELLASEKDRREHAFVETAIRDRLTALCTSVQQAAGTSELRLARGRHLCSRLEGALRDGTTTFDVLRALHPTPAVGGVPTVGAYRAIHEQEPFERGWYAGPVGWIGAEAAEFAVAIRSGLVRGSRLALYSGAGIVTGSVPEQEWDEVEQKISDFAAVLDLAP